MATSTISNTLTDASGTPLAGVQVRARLQPAGGFRTADGSEVAPEVRTVTNASGVWSLPLERNSGISPANSFYVIEERLPASAGGPRMWTIQVGAASQTLFAALVNPVPAQSVAAYLTQDAADARYVQAPGSFGGAANISTSSRGDTASAGVLNTYARTDHRHARGTDWFTVCTSTTRPASPATGQLIFETNTDRYYRYTGSAWLWVAGAPPRFRVVGGGAGSSIANSANATIPFTGGSETVDTENAHASGVFTCPSSLPGRWKFDFSIGFAASATGTRAIWLEHSNGPMRYASDERQPNGASTVAVPGSVDIVLAAGETVSLRCFQSSGGALVVAQNTSSYFQGRYVGSA